MDKTMVIYQYGVSRHGQYGVDFMLANIETEDGEIELYAEVDPCEIELHEDLQNKNEVEVISYFSLKGAILDQAKEHGIDPQCLKFHFDK